MTNAMTIYFIAVLSGQEIIHEVLKADSALIPITVTEFGQFSSLFEHFMYGKDTILLPVFNKDKKHAKGAARLARSSKVPRRFLTCGNQIWRTEHADAFYGFS